MMDLKYLKKIQNFVVQENFLEQNNTGLPEFKIANLFQDIEMLKGVQSVAIKIMDEDPNLENRNNLNNYYSKFRNQ